MDEDPKQKRNRDGRNYGSKGKKEAFDASGTCGVRKKESRQELWIRWLGIFTSSNATNFLFFQLPLRWISVLLARIRSWMELLRETSCFIVSLPPVFFSHRDKLFDQLIRLTF
ncbi:hypothetical protein AWENTII_010510 [Aspergillus wentii]